MALLFLDSFDHYSTSQFARKWTEVTGGVSINTTNGRRGTGSARIGNSTTQSLRKSLGTNAATIIVGFGVKLAGSISSAGYLFGFGDTGADQMTLFVNADATLSIRRATTNVATSVATLNLSGVYQYIEIKIVHGAAGSYELRLDGVNILSASGVDTTNTANNYANQILLFNRVGSPLTGFAIGTSIDVDDLYVCDGTGSSNNDFLGDVRVDCFLPSGNGNSSQFIGNDSNSTDNYLLVDETPANDDTDYVQSTNVSDKDTYAFPNMSHTPASIYGLQINMQASKTDSGLRTLQSVIRSDGVDTDGTAKALSSGYVNLMQISEVDPDTSAAWTQSGFDAAEFGVKVAA